jgi:hypothetical protein
MAPIETQAPLGAEAVTPTAPASTGAPSTAPAASEPSFVEIKEDGLYKFPGQDKPVKPSEYVRGFQSQATKASQKAAELERKLQEREAALARYEQERARQNQAQPGNEANPLAGLESLPYLSGKDAAAVVRSIGTEFQTRDQITLGILKELQALRQVVKPIYESNQTTAFSQKISGWLKEGDYPEEYQTLAEELYLGYEPGPDLDREFPRILSERIAQVETALDKKRRLAADAARRAPFVPGKGGTAVPSQPQRFDPRRSAQQEAADLWDSIQVGAGT